MVHSFPAPPPFLAGACAHVAPPRPALAPRPPSAPRLGAAGGAAEPAAAARGRGWREAGLGAGGGRSLREAGRGGGAPAAPAPGALGLGRKGVGQGQRRRRRQWLPGAMWTSGRRPGRLRRAVSTCEPGGRGAGTTAEAGRGHPRRGAVSAQLPRHLPYPPPGKGRLSILSSPPRGSPLVPVGQGPAVDASWARKSRPSTPESRALSGRGGDSASARGPAPRAVGPDVWVPLARSLPHHAHPCSGRECGPGGQGEA